jgi:MATE family multidrug resistance protein
VSNELGAGRPQAAKLALNVVLVLALTEGILIGIVLLLIRNIWGYAYSNEVEVVKYVAAMMPILAASNFMDGLQCVLSGSVRGIGMQEIGAFINLGAYYLVGIPCAVLFAFVLHIGGKGLWLGILCALVVQVACLFIIVLRTNWEAEAKKAKDRVYDSSIPVDIVS